MLRERRRHANFKPNRKLDRKSSRGMIYENEELRLRTININAEVERGQSDIRKLRRENEQLRKEIWSLRDEYDRLDKLLRSNRSDKNNDPHASNNSHHNHSNLHSIDHNSDDDDDDECTSCNQSEGTSSCDTCEEDDYSNVNIEPDTHQSQSSKSQKDNLHVNFDHLSIVSEENLTNSDGNSVNIQADSSSAIMDATSARVSQPTVSDLAKEFEPEPGASLIDFQSIVPPLKHFETLPYELMGPRLDASGAVIRDNQPYKHSSNSYTKSAYNSESTSELNLSNTPIGWDTTNNSRKKHFFAPLSCKKIQIPAINVPCGPPDVFVQNALPSSMALHHHHHQHLPQKSSEQTYTHLIPHNTATAGQSIGNVSRFQTGGNLDDLLHDIEAISNDILKMQVDHRYQRYASQDKLNYGNNDPANLENSKPYRSEMNLLLTYDGSVPVIVPAGQEKSENISTTSSPHLSSLSGFSAMMSALPPTSPPQSSQKQSKPLNPGWKLQEEQQQTKESPPPIMPDPMALFPPTLPYIISGSTTTLPLLSANDLLMTTENLMNTDQINKIGQPEATKGSLYGKEEMLSDNELKANDSVDNKKKSRRVSIYFNRKITDDKKDKDKDNLSDTVALSTNSSSVKRHHHNLYNSNPPGNRKMSSDSTNRSTRARKSRRHSDSVVSVGGNYRNDSPQLSLHHGYGGTSGSVERNSNSLASSRESSTSLSIRSHKSRKMSVSSHAGGNNGKIPWCGCWGNGCV